MKILNCPLNGPRNISEFLYGGEVKTNLDPALSSDSDWAEHIFMENNYSGIVREWWLHAATAFWFIAERNSKTDEIVRTYPSTEIFKERISFLSPEKGPKSQ